MAVGPALVVSPGASLRRLPEANSPLTHHVQPGVEVVIVRIKEQAGAGWLRVRDPEGNEGWVAAGDAVKPLHAATVVGESVRLLSAPRADATVVVDLRRNAPLVVLAEPGTEGHAYVKVRLPSSGREGYVDGTTLVTWGRVEIRPMDVPASDARFGSQVARAVAAALVGLLGPLAKSARDRARTGPIGRVPP